MYNYKINLNVITLLSIFLFFSFSVYSKNFEIKIIGNNNLDQEFIESIVDLDINLDGDDLINYIIKELFSTGYFQSVDAEIIDMILSINLVENPVINKIKFIGNDRFKDDDLNIVIKNELIDTDIYNLATANKINKLLIQHYKNYGYNLVNISHSTKDLDNGQIDLYYDIIEGDTTKIKKINIIGNNFFSTKKIKSILRSQESKFYKIIGYNTKYNENLIYLDENRIRDYYLNQGFKNIKINSTVSEFIPEKNQVILNFFIDEGKRFYISEIDIIFEDQIDDQSFDFDEIINDLDIKKNKKFNMNKITKSSDKIYDYLLNQGFIFIDVSPLDTEIDNNVELVFLITKIKETYISEIEIDGNTRTKDRVIRRELEVFEGDPFIPSKVLKSRTNINNLNFFGKVDINATPIDNKMKIDIEVEEKPTGEFNIGALFDSYNGVSLVSGLKENNILGDGRYLALDLNTSADKAGINFEVIEPYIFNKHFNLIYNINFTSADLISSSGYKVDTQTAGIGSRYNLTENISHYVKLDYSIDDYHSITSTATNSVKNMGGENVQFTLSNRFSLSELDTGFRPSDGYRINWYNEFAISNFMRNKISYDKFYNFNKKVLSYRTQIANITNLKSGDVADTSKFKLGGRSLRGFDRSGVGPRNSSSSYIGGNNLLSLQIDYQIPISESELNLVDFVTFLDAGKIFSNDTKPTNSTESIRVSTGAGINFNTPIGPLSLTYAIPLQSESYDKEKKVVFSIGWVN